MITADRDAQIIALHQQGKSLREIATATGLGKSTVGRVIKQVSQDSTPLYSNLIERVENLYTPENTDVTCVESEILHTCEPEPDHDRLFKLLDISACFYGKHQVSPSEVSHFTGIDESEVREILNDWYQDVVISLGIDETYWMSDRDKANLRDKVLAPTYKDWAENFPEQKILCPPALFNPHMTAASSEH